jgi:carbamoyltransferase
MRILGLSAFQRDSAAALVVDGRPVAAAREERYTRTRSDPGFPARAVRRCLDLAGLEVRDLDRVVFYEKPLRKFERLLATRLGAFPRSARSFAHGMFLWLGDRLWMKNRIASELGCDHERIDFVAHQVSHAASAFFTSPFDAAALLTLDDAGEWATAVLGRARGRELEILAELRFPHSLGLFASAITQFLGFEPGCEEHKVEALAAHGTPRFERELSDCVGDGEDGGFVVDQRYFRFGCDGERLFDAALAERLGPPRATGAALRAGGADTRDADVAASLQRVLESRVVAICHELRERAPHDELCFAGELARNRTLVARVLESGLFRRLHVPPDPGNAGAALGAALYVHCRRGGERARDTSVFLGDALGDAPRDGARPLRDGADPGAELLQALLAGQEVGWARGRMEFCAQGQGHRAVLGDPRGPGACARLLAAIHESEPFLPCRLLVPAERAAEYFALPTGCEELFRFARVRAPATAALRAVAPSAIAPDGLAWPQLVRAEDDRDCHGLLTAFGERAGAPLLLHATLALRGSPMARTAADCVDVFRRSTLGRLVVEDQVYDAQ